MLYRIGFLVKHIIDQIFHIVKHKKAAPVPPGTAGHYTAASIIALSTRPIIPLTHPSVQVYFLYPSYRQEREQYGTYTMPGVFRPDKRQGHHVPPLRLSSERRQHLHPRAQESQEAPPQRFRHRGQALRKRKNPFQVRANTHIDLNGYPAYDVIG